MANASGPSATATWQRQPAGASGHSRTVLTLPDATDPARAYYVPARPALVGAGTEVPALSLTLLLDGVPEPDEASVVPRIASAVLALDVTLVAPPEAELEAQPLFARPAVFELLATADANQVLATAEATGTGARASLSVHLGRPHALAALTALDGIASRLLLRATVAYRAALPLRPAHLTGSWADVYDALEARGQQDAILALEDLDAVYAELLAAGVLRVSPPDAAAALYPAFASMAAVVVAEEQAPGELRLRGRPAPQFNLDLARTVAGSTERVIAIDGDLAEILVGALDQVDRERVVSLVSVDAGSSRPAGAGTRAVRQTPRRVRSRPPRIREANPTKLQFAKTAGGAVLATPARLLTVKDDPSAHMLLALQAVHTEQIVPGRVSQAWLDDDLVDVLAHPGVKNLPVVDANSSWAWPDRADPASAWYAPTFELLLPIPADDASTSPFVFSFARSGATASGEPGLDAMVTLRLRQAAGSEVAAALAALGHPPARPVPTDDASVRLELPFRDQTGATRSQEFPATVTRDGDVLTITVRLLDAWARLCYGALSQAGFQAEPARVSVAWSFQGYVQLLPDEFEVVFGGKTALTHIAWGKADLRDAPAHLLDAAEATFRTPVGDFAFRDRPKAGREPMMPARPAVDGGGGSDPPVVVHRPPIEPPARLPSRPRYSERTFVRSQRLDLLVPCDRFGRCYVEQRPEGVAAIGCQDALRLGQTTYRQYSEVAELADARYRVFRSLQQPGRFLVLPAAYLIARLPASKGDRAYRPALLLHALVDPDHPADNWAVIQATLQPDIPPDARAVLLARLADYAREPVLQLPTEVDCQMSFTWTLDPSLAITVTALQRADGIAVSLSADLAHTLLLRDLLRTEGVPGRASLTFPDGSTLATSLLLALDTLTGPLSSGPVETALQSGLATLTNRIERPVAVSDLLVATGGPELMRAPVERTLAPGASADVAVPAAARAAWPVCTLPAAGPAALDELRTFVEDIDTNVVFLDLVDHAAHGLQRIDIRARMVGVAGEQDVEMSGSPPVGSVAFVLPLTTYLAGRLLQYRITVTAADGIARTSEWTTWDLAASGSIVSLTWDAVSRLTPPA
jgi:hypothetical protein